MSRETFVRPTYKGMLLDRQVQVVDRRIGYDHCAA
jgi:hypothetical protein